MKHYAWVSSNNPNIALCLLFFAKGTVRGDPLIYGIIAVAIAQGNNLKPCVNVTK